MDREVSKKQHILACVFMALAAAAALATAWFCAEGQAFADSACVLINADSADESRRVMSEFFSCLEDRDLDGADRRLGAGTLGLDKAPEDSRAALLWDAQQRAWSFSVSDELHLSGMYLTAEVGIQSYDYSELPSLVRGEVNALLAEAAENALGKYEIYDEDGQYHAVLLEECLDRALDALLREPERFLTVRRVPVKAEFADGRWGILADDALISALTGGAVQQASGSAEENAALFTVYISSLLARSLEGLAEIPVAYRLAENTVTAPRPDEAGFGRSMDPADTAEALQKAEPLLDGRSMIWSVDTDALTGRWINWYQDDSIFAVTWRQVIGGLYCTFCEVVVNHPSQFRRYLADNSFNSPRRYTPTQMAKTVNAVVAVSGDFYKYRMLGTVVYQRELCRAETETLDTCFVDAGGNLLFVRTGELTDEAAIRRYIEDNDILFSLAFGPVMIENGHICVPDVKYPIGQIHEYYTRLAICQLGECHYLLVSASRCTLPKLAEVLDSMGVDTAYALDGGQTASIVIHGMLANPVDFGEERTMSDIMYFASAVPEMERQSNG